MLNIQRIIKRFYIKAHYLYVLIIVILFILLLRCKYSQNNCQVSSGISPDIQTTLIRRNSRAKVKCYLFLLIMTSPKGEIRRKSMRETWLRHKELNNMVVERRFIIGTKDLNDITLKQLKREEKEHTDILFLENHKDSYQALTSKLLKSYLWIYENVETKFVMKVDDDSFVRLDKLLPSLHERHSLGRIYWGFFRGNANVKRTGPWKEQDWFLSDHYLPYALGGGYIISFDLLEYISKNANWFSLYNSEDVSLGVWLAPIQINRIHDVRFDTEYKTKGCSNKHVVSHKQQPEDMYSKHNQLLHHNKLCKEESELLLTYDYNWSVSPVRCCKRVSWSTLKTIDT